MRIGDRKMKVSRALLVLCLVAALVATPVSAAEGGILQSITDFFFWWLPAAEEEPDPVEVPPVETHDHGMPIVAQTDQGKSSPEGKSNPETRSIDDGKTLPPEEEIPEPVVLGTVCAVDYRTIPIYGSAPLMVRFTASESPEIASYFWTFGDGFIHEERDNFHSYMESGIYTATLTVTDIYGESTSAEITITVEPPGVVPYPEDEDWF